ncbi:DUF421 domain-containing protein [Paenibacillus sp. BSR1-1]|uniref:DUF421 domain-containing protein n=1 Tax=Paenibacillus sp. BSR1-1 TaxID=3020845 RepID=UPI0025B1E291|nr:DUF421 domain-containing protein [Paenibacillus sp. BSR1-1]MDN3015398.1 DUF421 domain-containing protein [Paenibacillus sp. BSR1-1]
MHLVSEAIIRTCISYIVLMVVSLWVGKQVNSHTNYYNFALSITIGSFIGNMGFDTNLHFVPMISSFLTLILIYFFLSFISANSRPFRRWLSGQPTVIIENGKILDANMKKIRYTLDDLNQQLREQGIFDIFEVEYALLEVSGKLSVLKKTQYQNVSMKDFNPANLNENVILPKELIMDGKIIEKNFNQNFSKQWLEQELKSRSVQIKAVQYAVISSNGSLFIDLFDDHLDSPLDTE